MKTRSTERGGTVTRALARLGVVAIMCLGPSTFALATDDKDVRVSGRVVDVSTKQPVSGAMVYVRDWRAVCDAEGRFFITLPAGRWTLEAAAGRYQPATLPVDACAECKPEVEILLVPMHSVEEHVEISAAVNGGSDLAATTPVRPAEVLNTAGAFENVFRVLQTLPGVASTGEMSSRLSVRGGGPDQNMTVMDGVEIHNPYRLYGLISAFNPETVQGFELATGAFSAQYGDRLSSILTIENRNGKTSSLVSGSVGLSLTDGNVILEGRLPGRVGSWLVTARRTWYDLVAERFSSGDDELPAFTDFQARVAFDLGGGRSFTLSGLRSRERSNMEISEDFDSGVMDTNTSNDLVAATLFLPLGARASSRTIAAFYDNTDDFERRRQLPRHHAPLEWALRRRGVRPAERERHARPQGARPLAAPGADVPPVRLSRARPGLRAARPRDERAPRDGPRGPARRGPPCDHLVLRRQALAPALRRLALRPLPSRFENRRRGGAALRRVADQRDPRADAAHLAECAALLEHAAARRLRRAHAEPGVREAVPGRLRHRPVPEGTAEARQRAGEALRDRHRARPGARPERARRRLLQAVRAPARRPPGDAGRAAAAAGRRTISRPSSARACPATR